MSIKKINNIFTQEELEILNNSLNYSKTSPEINNTLGRLHIGNVSNLPDAIVIKIMDIVEKLFSKELKFSGGFAVEYSAAYGLPNLPVHYDHDNNHLIFNFQLSSNTQWGLGVDLEVYDLEDNSALVFNPNKYTHWRPHKIFKDGEFVKMIFFRFTNPLDFSDHSKLDYSSDNEIFKEINDFRDNYSANKPRE